MVHFDACRDFSKWKAIALVLGIEVKKIPGTQCGLPGGWGEFVLLEKFGAPNGMLLLPSGSRILQYADAIVSNGFGFSVIEPAGTSMELLESLKDALRDWGWVGPVSERPDWY